MIDIFLYKGICPFCDNKAEVIHIEQVDKINILVDFECQCDWKHFKILDKRKYRR
ncbi:hypothetical protein [Romboutsia sp. 1001713B170207_170306_H8]|uniref:hypothetical protein n=1 Tax=Romboutsia sp. 1001713B170207_170306_H8 TaxID=2787112 RepID=UPI00189A7482|nr:hypothetical protein [Romboutsia sp. 1001713B170207_170306_H8]